MIPIVLLDMDGVVCSFVDHALKTHGREDVIIKDWNIEKQLGMTKEQFQEPINEGGAWWWRSMPELTWCKKVVQLASTASDEFYFCSSPAHYFGASDGKALWLRDRLGTWFDLMIFTKHKHVLAKPGTVLIDDSERNCNRFIACGGDAVLFPAAWNSLGVMKQPEVYLEEELEALSEKFDRITQKETCQQGDEDFCRWRY